MSETLKPKACPYAKSDMTPCYLRDGEIVRCEIYGKACCVGCEKPFEQLASTEHER